MDFLDMFIFFHCLTVPTLPIMLLDYLLLVVRVIASSQIKEASAAAL